MAQDTSLISRESLIRKTGCIFILGGGLKGAQMIMPPEQTKIDYKMWAMPILGAVRTAKLVALKGLSCPLLDQNEKWEKQGGN